MNRAAPLVPNQIIEQTLDLTCEIQAIPAPTFNEALRADYFFHKFQSIGLCDVQRDPIGNVLARLPGGKGKSGTRPLVVSAHMDTVHPLGMPLESQRYPDRIVGPGIGDNALGLAALLSLARLLKDGSVSLPGDVWLAANVGEEGLGDLRGMQAVVDRFAGGPLAYLVVEGMGVGTILHRGLGVERFKITIQTPGGHSWADYGKPSAVHELCKVVAQLASIQLPSSPATSLNAGVIHGGTSINTIAAQAYMELDLRSESGDTLAELVRAAKRTARAVETASVKVRIEQIGRRQAGMIPASHPLVALARDVLTGLGIETRLDIASTDANLPLARGYPAICVGISQGSHAHTQEEMILTAPVGQGLAQLLQITTRAWEI